MLQLLSGLLHRFSSGGGARVLRNESGFDDLEEGVSEKPPLFRIEAQQSR